MLELLLGGLALLFFLGDPVTFPNLLTQVSTAGQAIGALFYFETSIHLLKSIPRFGTFKSTVVAIFCFGIYVLITIGVRVLAI